MEIQSLLIDQRTQVDVYGSPESVPTRESFLLLALDVPKRIADVLKIEFHSTLLQAGALAAPVSEEKSVRTLTRLVAVRAGERFHLCILGIGSGLKEAPRDPH